MKGEPSLSLVHTSYTKTVLNPLPLMGKYTTPLFSHFVAILKTPNLQMVEISHSALHLTDFATSQLIPKVLLTYHTKLSINFHLLITFQWLFFTGMKISYCQFQTAMHISTLALVQYYYTVPVMLPSSIPFHSPSKLRIPFLLFHQFCPSVTFSKFPFLHNTGTVIQLVGEPISEGQAQLALYLWV